MKSGSRKSPRMPKKKDFSNFKNLKLHKAKYSSHKKINMGKLTSNRSRKKGAPIQNQEDHFRLILNKKNNHMILKSYETENQENFIESARPLSVKVGEVSISDLIRKRVYNKKTG